MRTNEVLASHSEEFKLASRFFPRRLAAALVGGAACLVSMSVPMANAASADNQTEGSLEAIVVTAQKRAQSVQDVSIAIYAITGNTLNDRHILDITALAQSLPNVGFSNDNGGGRIAIRGITFNNIIATDAEPRVAYDLDGIYIGRPSTISGTFFDRSNRSSARTAGHLVRPKCGGRRGEHDYA